ncbi:MAG: hypothetical protein ABIN74_00950, partial [Ferruginibacter sp.]
MAVLHNRISQAELKKLLYAETEHRTTISFYRYFQVDDPRQLRDDMYKALQALKVFGRIYIATEGINAQVSVPDSHVDAFRSWLNTIPALKDIRLNFAVDNDGKSFWVLKIKVREKIVADGIDDPGFSMQNKGSYVNAIQMNELLAADDTIVIDMRNHYEYEVGHFEKA